MGWGQNKNAAERVCSRVEEGRDTADMEQNARRAPQKAGEAQRAASLGDEKAAQAARGRATAKKYAVFLGAGLLYFAFVTWTGLSLPCPIRAATGFLCPGCGITQLFLSLAQGDLSGAWAANPALCLAGPLLLTLLAADEYAYIRTGRGKEWPRWLSGLLLAFFLLFAVGRNLLR